jgi:putative membrane protein
MNQKFSVMKFIVKVLQGALIGLGAVLPGISGGVLCVVFGIYKTIMEFLADPFRKLKTHLPKLIPIGIGGVIGFLGVANVLSFLLDKYPSQSVCVFIGLIGGMLPSLWKEAGEKGRNRSSIISMIIAMVFIFALLIGLQVFSVQITPNFLWYIFCGCCLALSVIAPGMSFSTLLMPLGLYEPFVAGIGHLDFGVLIPGGIGGLATVILFAKAVDTLFDRHYSVAFHAIVGVVIAATIMIIPFASFTASFGSFLINTICLAAGALAALYLDKFNQKFADQK